MDPRPLIGIALDQAGRLVDAVDVEQLGLPTPCDEYDVRTLLGHLLTVVARIDLALRGGNPLDIPVVTTGIEDDALPSELKARRATLDATLRDDAVLDRICTLPWGTLPGRAAIAAYAGELTTHGWDLATATGNADLLDPALAEACLPMVTQSIPADPRGGPIPFGPVVPVPADAPPYTRLAAWTGRTP